MADHSTDEGLKEDGWAAGWDVWDVIRDTYGGELADDDLAEAQLQSLKRAIRADYAADLHSELSAEIEAAGSSDQSEEPALGRHEDGRGVIQDLLGRIDSVTEISTMAGAVRGNHCHKLTTQWTYVTQGALEVAWLEDDGVHTRQCFPGDMITEQAGIYHAWKAITGCRVLVFTRGPRSGEAYETDTTRLDEKDWLLR